MSNLVIVSKEELTPDGYMRVPVAVTPLVHDFIAARARALEAGCGETEGDGEGYLMQQTVNEIAGLVAVLKRYGPFPNMLDIGIGSGGTTRFLTEHLDIGHVTIVDNMTQDRCEHWERNKAAIKVPVTEVRGDSKDPDVWIKLREMGTVFDLVGIDGMHTTDYVANDWNLVLPHLRLGSIVWFHDINLPDVQMIWASVALRNPIIYRCGPSTATLGIGALLFLNSGM